MNKKKEKIKHGRVESYYRKRLENFLIRHEVKEMNRNKVAKGSGVSPHTINRWLRIEINTSMDTVDKIVKFMSKYESK